MRQAGLDVLRAAIATDNPDELQDAAAAATPPHVDLIVTTGGVSKGAYEVVRQAMADQDVEFLHVAMQPGGPQGIGTFDGVPFLGFPGKPGQLPGLLRNVPPARPRRTVRRPGSAARRSAPGWPSR